MNPDLGIIFPCGPSFHDLRSPTAGQEKKMPTFSEIICNNFRMSSDMFKHMILKFVQKVIVKYICFVLQIRPPLWLVVPFSTSHLRRKKPPRKFIINDFKSPLKHHSRYISHKGPTISHIEDYFSSKFLTVFGWSQLGNI